jgi:hypothetical protein
MNTSAPTRLRCAAFTLTTLSLAACGGGGGDAGTPFGTDIAKSTQAATTTAANNSSCVAVKPFYWEIGDKAGMVANASVNAPGSLVSYSASSVMSIASASKWLYGAYVVERRGAAGLNGSDIKFLNFRSGYTSFTSCSTNDTVGSCAAAASNGTYTAANDGKFFYGGGHMQAHANLLGLGALDNTTLATELQTQLGSDVAISYTQPQPAGGVRTSADNYARFLRKLLGGQLRMGAALGSNAVCTNPATCSNALSTPIPGNESWQYSVGHWVESDPAVGDGAFSSAGAFGFYPWVDAGKRYYGVVARVDFLSATAALDSVRCGRLIRKAWATGLAQ